MFWILDFGFPPLAMKPASNVPLEQLTPTKWRIPKHGDMRVEGIVYANEAIMKNIRHDQCLEQVRNVATLPGIVERSIAMPDIHWGYGFPIGGVAAFDVDEGVISPGGVGYDINCGVRLMRSDIHKDQLKGKEEELVGTLFDNIPTGVGSSRKDMKLSEAELRKVAEKGAKWAVGKGFGEPNDPDHIEGEGCLPQADPDAVGEKPYKRGRNQVGTLGSGNHFCEIAYVDKIYDEEAANALELYPDHLTAMIHTGSRGFGYQICDDYLQLMDAAIKKYGIELPDRQLACAPFASPEGQQYLSAMACGANFAFCNRQLISHWVRESFEHSLGLSPNQHGLHTVYDVCHNIAKVETFEIDGKERKLCIHRKGATRAFPPGHPQTPDVYKDVGQPVLIPGDMGRYSFVLVGTDQAYQDTWGSCCHGAGRLMSRHQATKAAKGRAILRELEDVGIYVKAKGWRTVVEEMPEAYKDVENVVNTVHEAGIGKMVARLRPICVIKG